jgi:hypothetical protein
MAWPERGVCRRIRTGGWRPEVGLPDWLVGSGVAPADQTRHAPCAIHDSYRPSNPMTAFDPKRTGTGLLATVPADGGRYKMAVTRIVTNIGTDRIEAAKAFTVVSWE